MGAKIAILTVSGESGFYLYQSDVTPYCLKALKWRNGKGDIVRDFVNSCRKYGVKPGLYIGIRWNSFFGIYDFKTPNDGTEFQKNRQQYYNKMCEGVTKELMTRYGDLAIVWYDGGGHGPELGGADILPIVEKYQKNIIFYHNSQRADIRWGGSESGMVPYPCWGTYPFPYSHSKNQEVIFKDDFKLLKEGDPNGKYYMPAMSDVPLRDNGQHDWVWVRDSEKYLSSVETLMKQYYNSVGHNSTLIIGVTPDNRGLVPEADSLRMAEFGKAIKEKFNTPIETSSGEGNEYLIKLKKDTTISYFVIQENIKKGERVRKYQIKGKIGRKWTLLAEGSCIGHKRIQFLNTPVKTSSLRLEILESVDKPEICNFSVY